MVKRFFAYSHLLIRIFAHSCIHCETSAFVLQLLSLQVAFSCSFLFSSLLMFMSEFAENMNLEINFYKTMNEVEINCQKHRKGCSNTTFSKIFCIFAA